MYTYVSFLRSFPRLQWWGWGKVVSLFALPLALATRYPLLVALALHAFCDFACQSTEVAMGKSSNARLLVIHALAAGALPCCVAFLPCCWQFAPLAALLGFAGHLGIDCCNKFGLDERWGTVADQTAHIVVLAAIMALR